MVGVAAQQYSGLTGCAFGCLARNARNICESIDNALKKDDLTFKTLQKIDIDKIRVQSFQYSDHVI